MNIKEHIVSNSIKLKQDVICGVYFLICKGNIVYVGSSKDVMTRITNHRKNMFSTGKFFDSYYIMRSNHKDIRQLEPKYIKMFKPKYNIVHKNDIPLRSKYVWKTDLKSEKAKLLISKIFN